MPDAPTPIFNSLGDLVEPWKVVVEYDATNDVYRVTRQRMVFSRGGWRTSTSEFPMGDLEDALAAAMISARTMSARRLL